MIGKADRLNQVGEYYFSTKLAEIAAMRQSGIDILNLGIGSPDLAPADEVVDKLIHSASDAANHAYQPYRSTKELREAMSRYYAHHYHVNLDPDKEILPLLGSKEGVMYISLAFLNPGDVVLVPNPGYPAYAAIARMLDVRVVAFDLDPLNSWQPKLETIAEEDLKAAKLMWVTYPNMPTGAPASIDLFDQLELFGEKHRILICNDNPYSLVLNEHPLSILSNDRSNDYVIELNSLSKSFNMAGWRVGMVVGKSAYIDAIIQAKSNVDSGMFLPVQHAAIEALDLPDSWHDERNEIYRARRGTVIQILETIGCQVAAGQVGMFIWAKIPENVGSARELVDSLLHEAHVFITPGEVFGSNGERYVRISLTSPLEKYEEALKRVKKWKAQLQQSV